MGGNAFSSRHLNTPRMPSRVYQKVKQRVHEQLRTLYDRVETPIEGPGKTDHGDIDVLVLARDDFPVPTVDDVASALGAAEGFKNPGDNATTMYFAVEWPDDDDDDDDGKDQDKVERDTVEDGRRIGKAQAHENRSSKENQGTKNHDGSGDTDADDNHRLGRMNKPIAGNSSSSSSPSTQQRYIQVDVHVCPTTSDFRYTLLTNAHSDLRSIIGVIIRPFGLITSTPGLCIIIPELESQNRSLSRITLTNDPDRILEYLGLHPVERYWTPFPDWNSAMDYARTCRFWNPEGHKAPKANDSSSSSSTRIVPKQSKLQIKAHDRSKAHARPMLRYWFDTYLPSTSPCPSQSTTTITSTSSPSPSSQQSQLKPAYKFTHADLLHDLQTFFGQQFTQEYTTRKDETLLVIHTQKLWSDIRKSLPCKGSDLTYTMKGLKYEILEHDGESEGNKEVKTLYKERDYEGVQKWVGRNWEEVKERQIRRDREKSSRKILVHLDNKSGRGRDEEK